LPYDIPRGAHLTAAIDRVRLRQSVPDREFDAIFPESIREVSSQYWTPLEVAQRAAEMLAPNAATHVLDVGSGAGKFCLVGALTTPGQFTGVEQRGHLQRLARAIAAQHGVRHANYVHAEMREIDWGRFGAFYFFNPFGENHFCEESRLDNSVELSPQRFERDAQFALNALSRARVGTHVVTYHGMGAEMPRGYDLYACEKAGTDVLEHWVKVRW